MFALTPDEISSDRDASRRSGRAGPPLGELVGALACTSSPEWDAAACRHTTPEVRRLFFSTEIADLNQAISVCAKCPLAAQCLQGALQRQEPWGVWGGHLIASGRVVTHKRPRGRPRKSGPTQGLIQLVEHAAAPSDVHR